ncbi:hypothetical protein PHAVU_008G126400 [Phaseolus vulgaris]|uniref:Uncharacterized protein n=1 Tax=Phaseolus vulgaris TaxID=3885 RepID=V7B4V1_PHAVU|nr:hypothetical protein PHAVU_008G126400g [Phaseolus vulgaris]ESW12600.1 hypothetical protein PHAVU_008G126400g [Phaseolus vulgaris]
MTSIKQHPHGAVVIMAQPISIVKDPIFLNRLKKAFQEQLRAHRRKRRNTTTKLLFEVPFSFQIPTFCLMENIDLNIVLLNRFREGGSWGNHIPQFSIAERFQNWLLEKRERNRDNNNGILIKDWFYHHLPSQQTLRSQQEVFNFLITGDIHLKDINKKAKQSDATAAEGI